MGWVEVRPPKRCTREAGHRPFREKAGPLPGERRWDGGVAMVAPDSDPIFGRIAPVGRPGLPIR